MEEYKMSLIGDKFPQMEVRTTRGVIKLPNDYSGKWFILFSHPVDLTPVCTTEFVAFQKLNCELIGLSIDQVFTKTWYRNKVSYNCR